MSQLGLLTVSQIFRRNKLLNVKNKIREKRGSERFSNLPEDTQLMNDESELRVLNTQDSKNLWIGIPGKSFPSSSDSSWG